MFVVGVFAAGIAASPAGAALTCGSTGVGSVVASENACTYSTAGTDTFTVPAGVSQLGLDVFGAQGGGAADDLVDGPGGLGGEATATLAVTAGETLEISVGGVGGYGGGTHPDGGGGASDVRSGSCAAALNCALSAREVVAGGGGGGGGCSQFFGDHCAEDGPPPQFFGGFGGAGSGADGVAGDAQPGCSTGSGGGGTATAGGAGGSAENDGIAQPGGSGVLGFGGGGGSQGVTGGSGGDGYYGGGGGASTGNTTCNGGAGGGGSGFITSASITAATATGVQSGAGKVVVSTLTGMKTSTGLKASSDPVAVRGEVIYTATVTAKRPIEGGTVRFYDGGTVIPGCANQGIGNESAATCEVSYAVLGAHSITASYSGDPTFLASISPALTETVNPARSTATALVSSATPATVRQQVTYTATVSPIPDSGTVAFSDGGTTITGCDAQSVDSSGQATCSVSYAAARSHSISAAYAGDNSYPASTSSTLTETVNPAASTATSLTSSSDPSSVDQQVTYTAKVTPVPDAGTVAFSDGSTVISACGALPVNTSSGTATCTATYTLAGSHQISAAYTSGDSSYPSSQSSTLTQTVEGPEASTTVVSSADPSGLGQEVIYTAHVAPISPATTQPTGTVSFEDGGTEIASCAAQAVSTSTGEATCAVTYDAPGPHSITAVYSGDSVYPGNTTSTLSQTVSNGLPSYTAPGTYLFTVPAGVSQLVFDAFGAQGGGAADDFVDGPGGLGGEARATLAVTAGERLEISVGAVGGYGGGTNPDGGGGASDVRSGSCAAALNCALSAREVVAGGGGGGGGCTNGDHCADDGPGSSAGGFGGAGSGADGVAGDAQPGCATGSGGGGTTAAGGAGGSAENDGIAQPGGSGVLGFGGGGGANGDTGGGGGDGYYGGGGGASTGNPTCDGGAGGGGSGFIISTAITAATATGVQSGTGKVVITSLATTLPATAVSDGGATLNGVAQVGSVSATYHFDYGTTTSYGTSTPETALSSGAPVSASITNLTAGRTYHYRLVVTVGGRVYDAGDREFTAIDPRGIMISELRLNGPPNGGSVSDAYVDLYNSTPDPIPLSGWTLVVGSVSLGQETTKLPAGTTLQPRAHLLLGSNSLYSLKSVADADVLFYTGGKGLTGAVVQAPDGSSVDSVGYVGTAYSAGTGLTPPTYPSGDTSEIAFVRRYSDGVPVDTGNNAADFVLVATDGDTHTYGEPSVFGTPAPFDQKSPVDVNDAAQSTLLDDTVAETAAPNFIYTPPASGTISEANPGKLELRRTIVNCFGEPRTGACANAEPGTIASTITRLWLDVTGLSTYQSAAIPAGQAALRVITSSPEPGPVTTAAGPVTVAASSLNAPSSTTSGGGLNATLTVPLPSGGLIPGQSVSLDLTFDVDSLGKYTLAYNALDDIEPYAPLASSPPVPPISPGPAGSQPTPVAVTGTITTTSASSSTSANTKANANTNASANASAETKGKAKPPTAAQRLARAIRDCSRLKNKRRRAVCVMAARRKSRARSRRITANRPRPHATRKGS